jgi:hypothetical protein
LIELRQDGAHPPGPDVLALIDAHLRDIDLAIANLQHLRNTLTGVFEQAKASVHGNGLAGLCRILEHTAEPPAVSTTTTAATDARRTPAGKPAR